ncbi:retinol dehydrogenase 13-like [Planococcus citri]|uniref:retinol dehydrogenase 13-like n=1 Tax=Planococcus citri TaxID=170843 RepID=UPI0031FA10FA
MIPRRMLIGSAIGTCLGIGFLIKDYLGGKKYTYRTNAGKNKVIIITGANTGIGKGTAKELAFRKANLVLACRDLHKCEKLRAKLIFSSKNQNIRCIKCDLSSQKSIKKFVDEFNQNYQKLDVLINNAGVYGLPRKTTVDGIEMHFGVNHIGHFLLTNLLLPKLKESAPSRIINLTSITYKKGNIDKEDLNFTKTYNIDQAYNQSKLANVLFTKELAKRLEGTGVTANAVYPGVVNTDLMRHTSFYNSWISGIALKPILWAITKNLKQGSQPVLYAAIAPELATESGYLFCHNFEKKELVLPNGVDESTAKWLWDVSMKWTKML